MKKFEVRMAIPYVYEVKAKDSEEACEKAQTLFENDTNDWVEPEIEVKEVN